MGGVLLGFALGAMAFTAQGRELGNKVSSLHTSQVVGGTRPGLSRRTWGPGD